MIPMTNLLELWTKNCDDVTTFSSDEDRKFILSKLPFWKVLRTHVSFNGPLPPLRTLHDGLQEIYSETKGGEDDATKFRAFIPSHTSHLK